MSPPLLQLSGIAKSFGAVRALRGVTFDLRAGEVHALLGENGAGKSTLIKVITGAHAPDAGTIEIDGKAVARLTPKTGRSLGIAAIYQQPALFPDLSVAENIALALEPPRSFARVRWPRRHARALELLNQAGARINPDARAGDLSMPEQQLVEIAKALGAGARILLMDEPTASLTAREVEVLLALVKSLRQSGVGIIYITHRLGEVFEAADRVTVLRDGASIGTRAVARGGEEGEPVDEAELIRMMVGREVAAIFPPSKSVPGQVVFSAKDVSCREAGIHDVSFEVRSGEVLGLAGLVGAGRTELARVLFGITPADAGTIQLNGRPVSLRSPAEAAAAGLAYVPEDRRRHGVILDLPISQNITMGIHPGIFRGGFLRFGAERRLAESFIRDLAIKAPSPGTKAGNLSGGNQQKVALARWLAAEPKVLILDEPTQGVDVGAKAEIHRIIRELAARGLAVIMISSELPEILGMSDRIAVMHGGTITAMLPGQASAREVMAAALG